MDNNIHTIQPQNPNLIEITTPIQARRGNRQFFCQQHEVSYITYANGYVRREINIEYTNPIFEVFPPAEGMPTSYKIQNQFVLNRRESVPNQWGWGFNSKKVIKEHCAQVRMDMIDRISANYKGYRPTGRYNTVGHKRIMK